MSASANELDGMHYDRDMRMYVPDVVSGNDDEPRFTMTNPPIRIHLDFLPTSPKSLAKLAVSLGWSVTCWETLGDVSPALYKSASDEDSKTQYSVGDVKFDGYKATLFVVEAREPRLPIGLQAHYLGKYYGEPDEDPRNKTRNTKGSFEYARLADPVGIPVELRFDYEPIKVTRGTDNKGKVVETEASFERNKMRAERRAILQNREYNDGLYVMREHFFLTAATPVTAWLKQWGAYGALSHETDREAA